MLDEQLARQHARRLGLRLTGTLGVLVKAKQRGPIPTVAPLIADLRRDGLSVVTFNQADYAAYQNLQLEDWRNP